MQHAAVIMPCGSLFFVDFWRSTINHFFVITRIFSVNDAGEEREWLGEMIDSFEIFDVDEAISLFQQN
jgi:hypothetical protein